MRSVSRAALVLVSCSRSGATEARSPQPHPRAAIHRAPTAHPTRPALAPIYVNAALGEIAVRRTKGKVASDFGEWASEVASRKNVDDTISLVTITPGLVDDTAFVVGTGCSKRTSTLLDYQHDYVFVER